MVHEIAKKARVASVIAATSIALGCGTNYAFSAWGPDMADRMSFSATSSNIIGAAGNLGQYGVGIPAGMLIDSRGPRTGILLGGIALACGYFPIYKAFISGPGSSSVAVLSFCSFLTGAGSCTAFSGAIKTSAYNWPHKRGTATAYPLSAFGLSAFVFTGLASLFFQGSTSSLLLSLAIGTLSLNLVALPFIRLIPSELKRPGSIADSSRDSESSISSSKLHRRAPSPGPIRHRSRDEDDDENASLVSSSAGYEDVSASHGEQNEVTGIQLLRRLKFWQLFGMMALLAGVGLMTINNIGNDAAALWQKFDPSASHEFVQQREHLHVGILSICSFFGRLGSGIFSDYLVTRLRASRLWCLVASASVFAIAQVLALTITDPNLLFLVSSLTGIAYGALFGVYPALVADAFGVNGLSLNWGFIILAPVLSANVFNLWYGHILDTMTEQAHSTNGQCTLGIGCYRPAYWLTLCSALIGTVMALTIIKSDHERKKKQSAMYARANS